MRSLITTILLSLLFTIPVRAQMSDTEKYYPENERYKKQHVKQCIYINPDGTINQIFTIDKKGRITLTVTPGQENSEGYTYITQKDTLIRYTFIRNNRSKTTTITDTTKFIYNAAGRIVTYMNCNDSMPAYDRFLYNSSGHLIQIDQYSIPTKRFYKKKQDASGKPIPVLTQRYLITTDEQNRIICRQATIGQEEEKFTETFIYNNQNQLIEKVHFQENGYLFCSFRANSIKHTTTLSWAGDSCVHNYNKTWATTGSNVCIPTGYKECWHYYPNGLDRSVAMDNEPMQRWEYRYYPDPEKATRQKRIPPSESRQPGKQFLTAGRNRN